MIAWNLIELRKENSPSLINDVDMVDRRGKKISWKDGREGTDGKGRVGRFELARRCRQCTRYNLEYNQAADEVTVSPKICRLPALQPPAYSESTLIRQISSVSLNLKSLELPRVGTN